MSCPQQLGEPDLCEAVSCTPVHLLLKKGWAMFLLGFFNLFWLLLQWINLNIILKRIKSAWCF